MFKDFQVKTVSKDVATPANLFKKWLWHLDFPVNFANFKNTFLYRAAPTAASDNTIFTTEPMKWINTHDFLVRSLCFAESEDKERCYLFRRAICRTSWSFLSQTRHAFFCTSPMFQACACDQTPHMLKPDGDILPAVFIFTQKKTDVVLKNKKS